MVMENQVNTMANDDEVASTITRLGNHFVQIPSLKVVVRQSDGVVLEKALGLGELVCGSLSSCDIRITNDSAVSRKHCELRATEKGIELSDLSKNGTYFGPVKITKGIIPVNVPITLGAATLIVREDGPPIHIPISSDNYFGDFISQDIRIRAEFHRIHEVSGGFLGSRAPVHFLIAGESGTGKTLLAKNIHTACAPNSRAFVVVECAGFGPGRPDIELIGYESGAFPGVSEGCAGILENAQGGTVVLSHINHLPQETQSSLARAIMLKQIRRMGGSKGRPIDVRIVATVCPEEYESINKSLLHCFARPPLKIPALRERKEDIPLLADLFWASKFPGMRVPPFSQTHKDLVHYFKAYDWPHNVRELEQCMGEISPELDQKKAQQKWFDFIHGYSDQWAKYYPMTYNELKEHVDQSIKSQSEGLLRAYLLHHLGEMGYNIQKTSKKIDVSRQWLTEMMKKLGIPGPQASGLAS